MILKGKIRFQKQVHVEGQDCFGCARSSGNYFDIRISQDATDNLLLFADTLLHELCHLWIFIVVSALKVDITEKQQHRIINKIVPNAANLLQTYCNRRVK